MSNIKSCREQMYFVIVVPLNAEGNGPCNIPEAVKLDFQVWDQVYNTFSSNEFLADAIDDANRRNAEHERLLNAS